MCGISQAGLQNHDWLQRLPKPWVSVVVPVRDPTYGGGLLHRAEVFLNTFAALAGSNGLRAEVIFVEWNPTPAAPRFREALPFPTLPRGVVLRFIEASATTVGRNVANAQQVPFMNTWARNVGVRRANGEFILVTGADVILNDTVMNFLARGDLTRGRFYRIDRSDLTHDIPRGWPADQQLLECQYQDRTVHTYFGSIQEPRPWFESERLHAERRRQKVLDQYQRHLSDPAYDAPGDVFGDDRLIIPADGLHRNASGDFFLMHRDHWHALRGYTELPTRGHGDSIFCWTAASAGLQQVILTPPARLYHQPHDREASSNWPKTDWRPWYQRYLDSRAAGTPMISNGDDWGLASETLPEWTFGPEHRTQTSELSP